MAIRQQNSAYSRGTFRRASAIGVLAQLARERRDVLNEVSLAASVPRGIDVAVFAIPAKFVAAAVAECGEKKIPGAATTSATATPTRLGLSPSSEGVDAVCD
jgi:hypothetical protein